MTLNGTGQGENDPGLLLALTRFGDTACVLLGQDRHGRTPETPFGPGALRQARRGMRLATDLDLPLVTVIDTAGAELSREAEEGGVAGEIARSIADMVALPVPTVSVLLGQGTGGGALALLPADRILAAQHGWLSPSHPRGPARSFIATRATPRSWPSGKASGLPTCWPTASSTTSFPNIPTPPTNPRSSAAVSAPPSRTNSRHSETSQPHDDSWNANTGSSESVSRPRLGACLIGGKSSPPLTAEHVARPTVPRLRRPYRYDQ